MAESLIQIARRAWANPVRRAQAEEALAIYRSHTAMRIKRPGMDTMTALAIRLEAEPGRTAEQAAAREYLYRWHLALTSPVFGVPHAIGL